MTQDLVDGVGQVQRRSRKIALETLFWSAFGNECPQGTNLNAFTIHMFQETPTLTSAKIPLKKMIPPHQLILKVSAICRFTRNFDASRGLTKNIRVIVMNLLCHSVEVETISAVVAGKTVDPIRLHLPRVNCHFQPQGFNFVVHQKRIPLPTNIVWEELFL
ncbi:hypothetical protein DFH07DRAFT_783919 [Mycena maculata]|uniref:Uncharacterized protein n=1 Tax=Mycena maculata TaxID=230809 RepID=A0AAD7HJF4_9AGAR|nr:hypothetical protein DFH07DRAFT_783919 [Mycena maculata]